MKIWKMDSTSIDLPALQEAANFLKAGQLVAFPTETVYGLGGNGLNPEALCKIFATKASGAFVASAICFTLVFLPARASCAI